MTDIVTITINPAIDIFTSVARVEPTRKLRATSPKRDPGGGGINVARVAHRLGGSVTAIYPAGGALGQLLKRLLQREGVESLTTPAHVETRENFTAFEEDSGEQYRFVLPGSRLHPAEWQACLDQVTSISPKPKFVVASGSVPPGVPEDFFAQVARQAKALGARAVLDSSGGALKAALREGVSLVKPNLNELSDLVGTELDDTAKQVDACRKLIEEGQTEAVALTLGPDGALLVTGEQAWRSLPLEIEPVSAVGAGDSFLGGMVWAMAAGQSMQEAFRSGVAAGSAAVLTSGTGLCLPEDVERLLKQVKIEEV